MKDTIRLSKRNKARLSYFNDDGNKAIALLLEAHDEMKIRLETRKEFAGLGPITTAFKVASQSVPRASGTGGAPVSFESSAGTISAVSFAPDYWSRMKQEMEGVVKTYAGGGY